MPTAYSPAAALRVIPEALGFHPTDLLAVIHMVQTGDGTLGLTGCSTLGLDGDESDTAEVWKFAADILDSHRNGGNDGDGDIAMVIAVADPDTDISAPTAVPHTHSLHAACTLLDTGGIDVAHAMLTTGTRCGEKWVELTARMREVSSGTIEKLDDYDTRDTLPDIDEFFDQLDSVDASMNPTEPVDDQLTRFLPVFDTVFTDADASNPDSVQALVNAAQISSTGPMFFAAGAGELATPLTAALTSACRHTTGETRLHMLAVLSAVAAADDNQSLLPLAYEEIAQQTLDLVGDDPDDASTSAIRSTGISSSSTSDDDLFRNILLGVLTAVSLGHRDALGSIDQIVATASRYSICTELFAEGLPDLDSEDQVYDAIVHLTRRHH